MRPPNPCDRLEKLVDRLKEQLDALCSQSEEHQFLQGLIDIRSLTDMTRTMLKDAEGRLASCRRHPVPATNRPFLVTFADLGGARPIADPGRARPIMETHQPQSRTAVCKGVTVCAGLGVLALSLGYALHENRVAQSLEAQNEQVLASLSATHSQLDSLEATVKDLDTRPELTPAPPADTTGVQETASPRQPDEGSGVKHFRLPLQTQRKVVKESRSDQTDKDGDLINASKKPTGSIAPRPDELAPSPRKGERNYYEFDIDKSKQFQKEGPLGICLKKANTKHQYADLELMANDQTLSQNHVNLYQPVILYRPDSAQPVEMVIDNISKDHIHGYVKVPEARQSELAAKSSNTPNSVPQIRSVVTERQGAGARWHGFSVNKILSRVKLRSDT